MRKQRILLADGGEGTPVKDGGSLGRPPVSFELDEAEEVARLLRRGLTR